MSSTLDIAVIADDLTGAADTGVQFCPCVGPVYMTRGDEGTLGLIDRRYGGVAIFTNTRNSAPARAADIVYGVAQAIHRLAPRIIYKKIDSCLRGNLGAEIDAMVQATGVPASFVAPAFPQQGRTTINNCHRINGIPIAETEISRDPLCPVIESQLSVLLASQSQMSVGHVPLDSQEKGAEALFDVVQHLLSQGCQHIVFDVRETKHLDAIANLARYRFENVLLVGSAGLAGSLARIMPKQAVPIGRLARLRLKRWLFVCGSASQVLADQTTMLAQSTGWPRVSLEPSVLAAAKTTFKRKTLLNSLATQWRAGSLILCIAKGFSTSQPAAPEELVQGLAEAAISLLPVAAPDGLFLSGGDTAEAVLGQAGSSAMLLHEEVLQGIMHGEIVGGLMNGLHLFTKAGAFGRQEDLIELSHSFT